MDSISFSIRKKGKDLTELNGFVPHDNVIIISQYSAVIRKILSELNENFNLRLYTFYALGEGLITRPEESYRVWCVWV
jgi:hypothetical protein